MEDSLVYINRYSNTKMTEKALEKALLLAKQGNSESFGQLYDHYFEKVYRFVYYRTSHKETAEDLTEEVFTKAYLKLADFKGGSEKFFGWVLAIARNTVIDYYRKASDTLPLEFLENVPDYNSSVLDELQFTETQKELFAALGSLPEEFQAVLKMRFFEELTCEEVADALGKSSGNVRVIQYRALKALKVKLSSN